MLCLPGHRNTVYDLAYSPDGQLLASASADRTAILWDLASQRIWHKLEGHTDTVWRLAFTRDGQTLLTAGFDGKVRLWDVATGECRSIIFTGGLQVRALAVPPTSTDFYTAGYLWDTQLLIHAWDCDTATAQRARCLGYVRGQFEVRLPWSASCPEVRFYAPGVEALEFTGDGEYLAVSGNCQPAGVLLWDCRAREMVALLGTTRQPRCLAYAELAHTGQKVLVAGVESQVILWDVALRQHQLTLSGHTDTIWDLAFSPDGRLLLTGSRDRTIKVWDTATHREMTTFNWSIGAPWAVAVAPDGMTAAAGGDGDDIIIWDMDI